MTTATAQPVSTSRPLSFNFVEHSLRRPNSSSHLRKSRVLPSRPKSSSARLSEMNSFGTMSLFLSEKSPVATGGTSSTPSSARRDVYNRELIFEDGKIDDDEISKRGRFLTGSLRIVKNKRSPSHLNRSASSSATYSTTNRPNTALSIEKRVSVVPEGEGREQEDTKADGFPHRNRFVTKDGMRHHPYPDEAPYMQAYDPVLLEK